MNLLKEQKKLKSFFSEVRNLTEAIVEPLSAEDMQVQTMADVSPTKWHLAHTTWFFETFLLKEYLPDYKEFNSHYNYLFNSYYNAIGNRHLREERGCLSRPCLEEVMNYRSYVDEAMQSLIDQQNVEIDSLIIIGLNHEQQHQELILTDIKHVLGTNPLRPAYSKGLKQVASEESIPLNWNYYPGGIFHMGHNYNSVINDFAFDNESPRHQVYVIPFQLASRLVSNQEYQEFIDDGAYQNPEWWLSDAWNWICRESITAPLYWFKEDGLWSRYGLGGLERLQANQPVSHVSFYEADAYARWAGARLAAETEWEFAASQSKIEGNFLEDGYLEPNTNNSLFGNLWQWTASPYIAYPGYKADPGALGEYNGKFMVNQMVLRGGSCLSSKSHLRSSYRNFFYPTARWQASGIRLAKDGY